MSNSNGKIVLKYFGTTRCPHSNPQSRAFDLINNKFREKYGDMVDIQIYMNGPGVTENKDQMIQEFRNARADYVPKITCENYKEVHLRMSSDVDTTNKSDEELMGLLLDNIYNQLNNCDEPEKPIQAFTNTENNNSDTNSDTNNSGSPNKKKMIIGGVCGLVVLIIIGYFYLKNRNKQKLTNLDNNMTVVSHTTSSSV